MGLGMRCETCGADVPSLGSLQMHQLRYHSGPGVSGAADSPSKPATSPQRDVAPVPPAPRKGRSGAVAPLALAVVALLSGGAFAATRSRPAGGPTVAELQAAAHRAVLTAADLPAGWTANPPDPAGSSDDGDRALAECVGAIYEDGPSEAESSFTSAGLTAASDFAIASSIERARADFAALAGPAAPGCVEQVMRKAFDADKPAGGSYELKVTPDDLAAGLPQDADHDAVGFRVTATFQQGKASVPMTFRVIMFRYDRIDATLTFSSVGPEFPADLARALTDAVGHRLSDNPA